MAGDWIKMRTDLADDPAVIGIAAAAGLGEGGGSQAGAVRGREGVSVVGTGREVRAFATHRWSVRSYPPQCTAIQRLVEHTRKRSDLPGWYEV